MSRQAVQDSTGHNENAARGTEVFVAGLPLSVSEEKLHEVFSACGEISEIRRMKDNKGNLKAFCFVKFTTKESAARAVREISGTMLDGKKIGVLPSIEKNTLYIGNLNKAWSANDFERIVIQVFPDIESIDLPMVKDTPPGQKQKNRGFAFVRFRSHGAASRAHRVGIQPDFCLGNLHPAVQWAEEDNGIDQNELAKIKIAFVRGLPNDAEENYLMQLFEPFGQVEKVVVSKRSGAAVGFVHYTERLNLEKAVDELNKKTVQGPNGGPMCKLQVEIARPMDKNKKRVRENSESTSVQDHSKLSKPSNRYSLVHQEMNSVDPYEEAVISLPLAVKERLLRILRLGIATRFDIDVRSLCTLKELPESNAISVLDQFMLSGASLQNKGAYLDGLISRHLVVKVGSSHSLDSLSRVPDTNWNEMKLYNISHQPSPHAAAAHFTSHAHTNADRPDIYSTRYSSVYLDHYPLPSRATEGRMEERGLLDYPVPSRTPIIDAKALPAYTSVNQTPIVIRDQRGLPLLDYPSLNRTPIGKIDDRVPDYPLQSQTLIGRVDGRGPVPGSHKVQIPRIQTALEERNLSSYDPTLSQPTSYGRVGLRMEEYYLSTGQTAPPGPSPSYPRPGMNAGPEVKPTVAGHQESLPQMRFDPSPSYARSGMNAGPEVKPTVAGHQESLPQMRFDPFSGEPYKFDPFTGKPIRPVNTETTRGF